METSDVIVVGCGIVGPLCAFLLAEEGLSVSVVVANGIGSGATGHGHGALSVVGRNFQTEAYLRLGIRSANWSSAGSRSRPTDACGAAPSATCRP